MDTLTKISALAAQIVEAIDLEIDRRNSALDEAFIEDAKQVLEATEVPPPTRKEAERAAIALAQSAPDGREKLQKILGELFDVERLSALPDQHLREFVETCQTETEIN